MTVVTGSFNVPGQSGLTGFSGSLWWVPTARHTSGSGVVLPVPFIVQVDSNGTMTPITVDPTGPTWVWKVTEQFNGIAQNVVRFVQVPASGTVAYKDLVDVDPNSLAPNAPVPGVVDGGTAALPNRFIQNRRDTAANWTAVNPVLAQGETGLEMDTKRRKLGDGTNAWNSLGYQASDQATLDATYATQPSVLYSSRRLSAALPGALVADNCFPGSLDSPVRTTGGTSRVSHTVAVDSADFRLVYGNWYTNGTTRVDVDNPDVLTVNASIEIAGTIYRVTFNGRTSATIDPGGMVISDPLPVEISAGTVIWSRTYVTSTGNWYPNHINFIFNGTPGGGGFTASTDLTAPGSAAISNAPGYMYSPYAVLATPTAGKTAPRIGVIGDSIAAGVQDNGSFAGYADVTAGGGYLSRALHGAAGWFNVALSGDRAHYFVAAAGHVRRARFLGSATHVVCEYGRNDIADNPLATVQADLITAWTIASRRGAKVFQTTITPQTTSIDGWLSVAGQAVANSGYETERVALNGWLRAGAPIDPNTKAAVAIGTTGALVAGNVGHPLASYNPGVSPVIEIADLAETARNSGIWNVPSSRTVTDAAITTGANVLTSATANFTSADLNRSVWIAGAGAGGSGLIVTINNINSATSVNLGSNASTTVSGAQCKIGRSYTADGLHPNADGATDLSVGVSVSRFV